ncbi:MAG: hypothetical protein QM775_05080 [Pirellulales bacterium]
MQGFDGAPAATNVPVLRRYETFRAGELLHGAATAASIIAAWLVPPPLVQPQAGSPQAGSQVGSHVGSQLVSHGASHVASQQPLEHESPQPRPDPQPNKLPNKPRRLLRVRCHGKIEAHPPELRPLEQQWPVQFAHRSHGSQRGGSSE